MSARALVLGGSGHLGNAIVRALLADGWAVTAAQRNTAETELLYKQGLARAIELIDANARRFDAEVNRATAKLAMEQAYLELRFALGLDPTDEVASNRAIAGGVS